MRLLTCLSLVPLSLLLASHTQAQEQLAAVPLYTETELLALINKNTHLARVKADDCQLVQDIEARANKMALPSYQFLYGDMLAYAVCVDRNVELGVYYMRQAAGQGLAAALEQLGRYYDIGRLVQKDKAMAVTYLREASAQGNLKAQLRLVKLFNDGFGSPRDYEDAYRWLFHAMVADKATHQKIETALAQLAKKMPDSVIARARLPM
ncbi:sel1 repeat family protein [Pseudoalteromonas sp. NEC-BIFX-2020_002]|uniref:tetratricopeptide repeat protein n=1 Tax=Pseudoalteromonas sp. NEC-BIFX-2020_002 TaxID=2732353 RepID=UPI0014778062|nr:SEL1-like repeat protein [Pseudoalteromonas sp. NEC-BIFX-2020_002]NNG44070.1 sel1 repeat family protein [Pseudoalteromonas sp. NEC-BIFX-2020_002]